MALTTDPIEYDQSFLCVTFRVPFQEVTKVINYLLSLLRNLRVHISPDLLIEAVTSASELCASERIWLGETSSFRIPPDSINCSSDFAVCVRWLIRSAIVAWRPLLSFGRTCDK